MMAARSRRLPSLNALRAFWTAARHGSLVQAATELHVTAAAVSQQVRLLEDSLGVPLFERTKKGLVLTETGSRILPGLDDAFEQLHDTLGLLEPANEDEGSLTISVAPSFATKWLLPRLSRFMARHPGIEVNVKASAELIDFETDHVDLAIRYGRGGYPGLTAEQFLRDRLVPVCSPSLVARHEPGDLARFLQTVMLLHDDSSDQHKAFPGWKMWLKAGGLDDIVDWRKGPHFDHSALAIEAALAGLGVALAAPSLVGADLEAGRLVRLPGKAMEMEFAYYLVYPPAHAGSFKLQAMRQWIFDELTGNDDTIAGAEVVVGIDAEFDQSAMAATGASPVMRRGFRSSSRSGAASSVTHIISRKSST
jgi:LysR family glycine cleavage system transcriptional activator